MKVSDAIERIGLKTSIKGDLNADIAGCYISDLLSDVMANSKDGDLWITIQTHPNIVAVAAIKGLSGIIITNGRQPDADTIKKAEAEKVTILTTDRHTFEIAGLLYNMLK
jgi:predicted transcriptional regulator